MASSKNTASSYLALLNSDIDIPFYEEAYFIILLILLLVISLVTLFIFRNRFSIKKFEAYSEYNTHIAKLRFLGLLFLLALPGIEWAQQAFVHHHTPRWELILIYEIILALFVIVTFIKHVNSIFINVSSVMGTSAIICMLMHRTFIDDMRIVYMLEVIVSMAFTVIVFNNLKHQFFQLLIVDLYFTYLFLTVENDNQTVLAFLSAFIAIQIFAFLFHLFQIHKLERISFSERILNSYDKLVIVYNIQGQVVYVNPFLKTFVNKRDEELMGEEWYKVRACSSQRTEEIKLSIRHQILEEITIDELNEEIYSEPHQKIRTVNWTFQILDGTYLMAIGNDITDFLEQQKIIEKLSLVAQHTQNPILITDSNYRVNWINGGFSTQLGYNLQDIAGMEPGNLLFQKTVKTEEYKNFVQQIEKGSKTKGDFILYQKDGTPKWMNVTVDPIKNEKGEITQFICLMQNIEEIKKAQAIIEEKNKDITDSISYAQRIQDALLPNLKLVQQFLPEHFVFYQPKDIVSGDFYYIESYNDRVFIGIADCTGHGVPGAMMTSIGAAALNNAILDKKLTDPAKILTHVDGYLKASLSAKKESLNDGMDIGLIVLNLKQKEIEYCGAKRPLVIVDGSGKINIIQGIKRSIGQFIMGNDYLFSTTCISISEDLSFYCFSDGIADQFGGENEKKIYQQNLIEFLSQNTHLPTEDQRMKLQHFVNDWQGENEQTDDMVLLGIKISPSYFDKINNVLGNQTE